MNKFKSYNVCHLNGIYFMMNALIRSGIYTRKWTTIKLKKSNCIVIKLSDEEVNKLKKMVANDRNSGQTNPRSTCH